MNTMTVQHNVNDSQTSHLYESLKNYIGANNFINSLKAFYLKKGFLTSGQMPHAVKFFKEQDKSVKIVGADIVKETAREILVLNNPVSIKLRGSHFVKMLCEEKLRLGSLISYAWTVTKVTAQTQKAIRVVATISDSKSSLNFCRACGKALTNQFSVVTGMGPVCSSNYGVEYITNLSQVEEYKKLLDERIKEAGEHEFWVPKSRIEYEYMNLLVAEMQTAKNETIYDKEIVEKIDIKTVSVTSSQIVSKIMDLIGDKFGNKFDYSTLAKDIFILDSKERQTEVSLAKGSEYLSFLMSEQDSCNASLYLKENQSILINKKSFTL